MKILRVISMSVVMLTLSACGMMVKPNLETKQINYGVLENSGVEIVAEDGSFKLTSQQQFVPPFQLDIYRQEVEQFPIAANLNIEFNTGCASNKIPFLCDKADLLDPQQLLSAGARKVRVKVSNGGSVTQLYGLLMLNKTFDASSPSHDPNFNAGFKYYSASVRNYQIAIPANVLQDAMKGRTTVAYEVFAEWPNEQIARANPNLKRHVELKSWILTLSKFPL